MSSGVKLMLIMILQFNTAQNTDHPPPALNTNNNNNSLLNQKTTPPRLPCQPAQTFISLLLLGLLVGLSGSVYLCVLQYICIGWCQPIVVSPESEALSRLV
ncbi:hypothetical protein UPYG_G00235060 [Umbra pygmaea]|uniref:Uncharacterized protein n=1 Tax=Umbra pygmaea TaxID=75934 RepID=A0ABD0X1Z8_UMBPY